MGQAAYGMREWENAANHFGQIATEFPNNKAVEVPYKNAVFRWIEQKHGQFDFKKMFFESKKDKAELDVADFMGPIEIAKIDGKGRGIIASKDIKSGTLLAVSKAFFIWL
uniref:Uncharacterized protein n=1 Tax=Panagrolaimus sp. PS1159 TaxID=55785 RepID=A0AC35GW38_9BILA